MLADDLKLSSDDDDNQRVTPQETMKNLKNKMNVVIFTLGGCLRLCKIAWSDIGVNGVREVTGLWQLRQDACFSGFIVVFTHQDVLQLAFCKEFCVIS